MFSITVKIGHDEKPVTAAIKPEILKAKAPATHKFNAHVVCILIGVIVLIVGPLFTSGLLTSVLATLPAFVQEGIDWLREW